MATILRSDLRLAARAYLDSFHYIKKSQIHFELFFNNYLNLKESFWQTEDENFSYFQTFQKTIYWYQIINQYFDSKDDFFISANGHQEFCQFLALLICGKNIFITSSQNTFQNDDKNIKGATKMSFHKCAEARINFKSSGTTKKAKWVTHSLTDIINTANLQNSLFENANRQSYGSFLPWHHVGGFMLIWRAFISQKKLLVSNYKTKYFTQHNLDIISLVPYQLKKLLECEDSINFLQRCKAIIIGGETCPNALIKQSQNVNLPLYLSYGLTESLGLLVMLDCQNNKLKFTPGYKIETSNNQTLIFTDLNGQKIRTSDKVSFQNNSFKVIGRQINTFKFNGEWVSPEEVENIALNNKKVFASLCCPFDYLNKTGIPILFIASSCKNKEQWNILKKELITELKASSCQHIPQEVLPWPLHIKLPEHKIDLKLRNKLKVFLKQRMIAEKLLFYIPGTFAEDDFPKKIIKNLGHFQIYYLPHLPYFCEKGQSWATNLSKDQIYMIYEYIQTALFTSPSVYMGYSLGGRMILDLYKISQIKMKKIILISTHPGIQNIEEKEKRIFQDSNILKELKLKKIKNTDIHSFFDNWYKNPIFGFIQQKKIYQSLIKTRTQTILPDIWILYWDKIINTFSLGHQEYNIPVDIPLLYLFGKDDLKYAALATLFKKNLLAKCCEIKNAGHALLYENPNQTFHEIKNFLNN